VAEWLGRGLQNLLQQFESARNLESLSRIKAERDFYFKRLFMKYSQLIGGIAVGVLAAVCYLPWSFIAEKNILVTGMSAPNTIYGKPGLMHIVLGIPLILFFIISKIWAKRVNLLLAAINLAWSARNYILLSTCYMGQCPILKVGLYVSILLSLLVLVMSFLPDLRDLEK
jgi:hypothetical protein